MLAEIGIVICLYVVTRMVELAADRSRRVDDVVLRVLAGVTVVAAVLVALDLLIRGASVGSVGTGVAY